MMMPRLMSETSSKGALREESTKMTCPSQAERRKSTLRKRTLRKRKREESPRALRGVMLRTS
jgi:hypothetical protein